MFPARVVPAGAGECDVARFGAEVAKASLQYLACGFIDHRTAAYLSSSKPSRCMEVGLGPDSFDCTGLSIRSICDVMGWKVSDWPQELRHSYEFARECGTEYQDPALPGGVALYAQHVKKADESALWLPAHVGIVIGPERMIHASSRGWRVRLERMRPGFASKRFAGAIPPETLLAKAVLLQKGAH